jgi:uncharacterized damage-inducible protein DinB
VLFTKDGAKALHAWTHDALDLVFEHVATMPQELQVRELPGFGISSLREQLTHILIWESAWIHNLQDIPLRAWELDGCRSAESLRHPKRDVAAQTQTYIEGLSDAALNEALSSRPKDWVGPLRSPAFILHHVVTHAFHHKGQIAAMCRHLGHPMTDTDLQRS